MKVLLSVPYSIGTSIVGDVMSFMIVRGESLPAVGMKTLVTVVDNQAAMSLEIFQGEHLLAERNTRLGDAEITNLPRRPRNQCEVSCRIEYNENGILQFSAREPSTGESVKATLVAKHEFTEDDHARMGKDLGTTRDEEVRVANLRFLRGSISLDVRRAKQSDNPRVAQAGLELGEWLEAHRDGEISMFAAKRREAGCDFYQLDPDRWENPADMSPFIPFIPIWPMEVKYVGDGYTLLHFLVGRHFAHVYAAITNTATDEYFRANDCCRIVAQDRMIESFIRIAFPASGKYSVKVWAGPAAGSPHHLLVEVAKQPLVGKFDVAGASSQNRPLALLLAGRRFGELPLPEGMQLQPSDWCVKLSGCEHRLVCKYLGGSFNVRGRELDGQPEQRFAVDISTLDESDGWSKAEVNVRCPGEGVWRLMFFVDAELVITQFLMTGSAPTIDLTREVAEAIRAKPH
jgi:hypothetical protein